MCVRWVWAYDPKLLAANEGGYEWWDKCLVMVPVNETDDEIDTVSGLPGNESETGK